MTQTERKAKQTTSVLAVVIMAYAIFVLLGVPDGMTSLLSAGAVWRWG